jgi:uncharacterized protein with HEPN domain
LREDRLYYDYLKDIENSCEKIIKFIHGMKFSEFKKDEKTQYAVIRALEILGEATKKIPRSVRNEYPNIPWREMASIRDKLIHDYIGINIKVVWNTARDDIPTLLPQIKIVISKSI